MKSAYKFNFCTIQRFRYEIFNRSLNNFISIKALRCNRITEFNEYNKSRLIHHTIESENRKKLSYRLKLNLTQLYRLLCMLDELHEYCIFYMSTHRKHTNLKLNFVAKYLNCIDIYYRSLCMPSAIALLDTSKDNRNGIKQWMRFQGESPIE